MAQESQITQKQEFFRQAVRELAQKRIAPHAEEIDRSGDFPQDIANILSQNQLLGLIASREYGGQGAGLVELCLAIEELSKACPISAIICATQNLGCRLILTAGSEEQKNKYLPGLSAGKSIYGLALNEPRVGADSATGSVTAASDGESYTLNGSGFFITNGDVAHITSVFASHIDKEMVAAFIVEKDTPGFSIAKMKDLTGGQARYANEGLLKDCHLHQDSLLGRKEHSIDTVTDLSSLASMTTAARATGLAQAAFDYSLEYAKQRVQFGRPIAKFQSIQVMLANMAAKVEASRCLCYKAAFLLEQQDKDAARFSAIAKYFASDAAMGMTCDAVQILGGYGTIMDYPVDRMMRNAKLTQITEGNNQAQQIAIATMLI